LFQFPPDPVKVGGGWYPFTVRVVDCAGNSVLDGTVVTLTSSLGTIAPTVSTTANGTVLATFRSGCIADWAVISATVDSRTFTTTLLIEPGVPRGVSIVIWPTTIPNCGGRAVITVTLRDECFNLVKDDTKVELTPQYGYVRISPEVAYTRRGVVTATVIAHGEKGIAAHDWPTALEQIVVRSLPVVQSENLYIRPGAPQYISLWASPEEIPILGDVNGYDITVVAALADCSRTAVSDGTTVRLETTKGFFRESGVWWVDRTTVGGWVTATLTSQSVGGRVTITATSGSAVGTANVYFQPGDPWEIWVWPYPEVICADGSSKSLITAQVFDYYNNDVGPGVTVTFRTDFGQFLGGGDTCVTTTSEGGYAFCTLVSDRVPRTATVLVTTENMRHNSCEVHFKECRYFYLPMILRRR
ncbi:MAG: hypothetical protein H5T63_00585, partial [Chloroflexi bacterium]|nr:hypothetical protein [Chloroflexota bacterium]